MLCQGLSYLKNLEKIELNFDHSNNFSDNIGEYIYQAFSDKENLCKITLELGECE